MSEAIRQKFNIPDDYTRDHKLTTWMIAHLGMKDLEGVYLPEDPEYVRDPLTTTGTVVGGSFILAFSNHIVTLSSGKDGTLDGFTVSFKASTGLV